MATSFGRTVIVALVALALAALCLPRKMPATRLLSLAAFLLAGLALALSGHASAAAPQWLTRPAVFVHGVAIAYWAGALIPLGMALRRGDAEAVPALRRFSATIPAVVALLVAAGVILAIVQVGTPAALVETAYGRVFLVKLGLLAILFALAAWNRWRLTGPAEGGDRRMAGRLVRSIAVETVVVLLILGVAAAWRFTPPPRALAAAAAVPASFHVHTAKAMAEVTITPGRAGPVDVSAIIMSGDFGPLAAKEVTLVFANPAAGIEPIRRPASNPGDGTWRIDGLLLPVAGTWTVRLDILISDFEMERLTGEVAIRP
jgi:copper transport protein